MRPDDSSDSRYRADPEYGADSEYTVSLERVFQGPMDLLLHLVREQEVEIHEVTISLVVEGFLAYVQELEELDLEFASDFVVMAATLMAIKSRSLLPREEVELGDELDPGDELIQQLIEYRRFKEASELLEERALARSRLHPRGWRGEIKEVREEPELDLSEVTVWDLLTTWSRLLFEIEASRPHQISHDPRPMRWYVGRMVERLKESERTTLRSMLDGLQPGLEREGLVGSFCALLELCKLGLVSIEQDALGGDIELRRAFEDPAAADRVLAELVMEDEEPEDQAEVGSSGEVDPPDGAG